jgi:gluconolactonase
MTLLKPLPEARKLDVFTRMPQHFRRMNEVSPWSMANRQGKPGDSFIEGPVFDHAGNLFITDIEYGRIFRIDPTGDWTLIVEYDGEPNGMKFLNRQELVVADYKNGLMLVDIHAGTARPFLGRRNSERFKGVNDLVFDSRGNLYFTDQGQTGLHDPSGRVYRLSAEGKLDMLIHNAPSPNGLVLSPDESVLFVAMTRDNTIWRLPLMPDGSVSKVGRFFSMNGPAGPDGLAMDVDGQLIVANPGVGIIWLVDHCARPVDILVSDSGNMTTNVAFGGVDLKTLYCTESSTGSILRAPVAVAGCALHARA